MSEFLSITVCDGETPRVLIGPRNDVFRCHGTHRGPLQTEHPNEGTTIPGVVEDPYTEEAIGLRVRLANSEQFSDESLISVAETLENTSLFLHPAERFFLRRFAQRSRIKLDGIERMKIWENLNGAEGYQVSPSDWVVPLRSPTLPPAKHTNMVVLGIPGLIIDPAATLRDEQVRGLDMIRTQKRQGVNHQAVFLTHHHHDHIGASQRFSQELGLPIWAHAETAARIDFPVDRTFDDGETVPTATGSDSPWVTLHTPGHAPGHLCLWNEKSGQLVAGDMVAGVGTILIDPEDGDMAQYLNSLNRLINLSPNLIYPSHGPVISQATEWLEFYVRHRLEREEKILKAASPAPIDQDELLAQVYNDVSPALMPLAQRSLESHLRKLINEDRLDRDLFGEIRTR